MSRYLNEALDKSLAALGSEQATIEECLARYPEHAADLRPLLEVALEIIRVPTPKASPAALATGKQGMLSALTEKKRRQSAPGLFRRYAGQIADLFAGREGYFRRQRSPALRWALATAAILVLLVVTGLILRPWPETRIAQVATLGQVRGLVEVRSADGDAWQTVSPGERVKAGSQLRTGPLADTTLTFFDGSTTVLEPETEIAIVQLDTRQDGGGKAIVLRQQVGQTYSHVQPLLDPDARFEIRTPTAVLAVRGTAFALDVETDGTTRVTVDEGVVDVTAEGSTVSVPAGQATEVKPQQPPAPILSKTPVPPGHTKTPQPPGLTRTSQPPGQTKTPQPPGLTKTPQPPGPTKTKEPEEIPEPTETSEPSETPEPTLKPPEPTQKPHPTHPPHPTEKPKPTKKP
jgi:hypothetical protein